MISPGSSSNSGLVLALDNSLDFLTVALARDGRLVDERRMKAESHSSEVIAVRVSQLLQEHRQTPDDLSAVIVTLGPGSFTGVRVGLSFCKGLCEGLAIPLVGVPTPDILVAPFAFMEGYHLYPLIDAKKGEAFFAPYRVVGGRVERTDRIGSVKPHELSAAIKTPCLCFGTGIPLCRDVLSAVEGIWIIEEAFQQIAGEALVACGLERLAEGLQGKEQKPVYGRRSEAEIKFRIEIP
jgi:tRNA threonylcarbamoyladenosine biosynthesis protein TsaB